MNGAMEQPETIATMRSSKNNLRAGFTLIEIMVVLLVMSVLLALAVPALGPALKGSKLKQSADDLERALANAQQVAITENVPVQFRFYRYSDENIPGGDEQYRAYEAVILRYDPEDHTKDPQVEAIGEVEVFPSPYVISDNVNFSTLVDGTQLKKGLDRIPRAEQAEYVAFEFRPDGSTNMNSIARQMWTITIFAETHQGGSLPPEFATLALDPFNGQVRRYQ